jgi:mRNA-degrading endonuclease RelE of RelBE toxin-antitoxin system
LKLIISTEFKAAFKRLAKDKQKAVERVVERLGGNPVPPSLKIRTFKNSNGLWIANVGNTGYRVIFSQPEADTAKLLDICPHDATYRKWNRRKR